MPGHGDFRQGRAASLISEEFSTHQMSTGSRQFHLLAVNVPKVRVTARLFPVDAAPQALAAYESYLNPAAGAATPITKSPSAKST